MEETSYVYAVGWNIKLFSQELNYLGSESLVMGVKNMFETIFIYFYFISIFILLTRSKATEALMHRVSNYSDRFWRCQDITVGL